eukprot:17761-Heterococcus_DN1.PRE.2
MEGIVYKFVTAPEKYLALWCGIVCCYIVYTILLSIRLGTTTVGTFYPGYSLKPRVICTTTTPHTDVPDNLVDAAIATAEVWCGLCDPGYIRPAQEDFNYLQQQLSLPASISAPVSASTSEGPDPRRFCITCLNRKPLRTKHCSVCGVCVARMCHHCVWLNQCVGVKNHAAFLTFVVVHWLQIALWLALSLHAWSTECAACTPHFTAMYSYSPVTVSTLLRTHTRTYVYVQIPSRGKDTWSVLSLLFSSEYFATLLLGAVAAAATVMLGMISVDQLRNAAANTTTNERMNRARYPWMRAGGWNFNLEGDASAIKSSNAFFNWYDRGMAKNLAEFCGFSQALLARKATAAGAACSSQRCSHDHHAHSQQQQQQLHDHDGQRSDEHSHGRDAHKHTGDCAHNCSATAQQAAAVHEQPQTQTEVGVLHETIHSAAHPAAQTLSNVDRNNDHTTGTSTAVKQHAQANLPIEHEGDVKNVHFCVSNGDCDATTCLVANTIATSIAAAYTKLLRLVVCTGP